MLERHRIPLQVRRMSPFHRSVLTANLWPQRVSEGETCSTIADEISSFYFLTMDFFLLSCCLFSLWKAWKPLCKINKCRKKNTFLHSFIPLALNRPLFEDKLASVRWSGLDLRTLWFLTKYFLWAVYESNPTIWQQKGADDDGEVQVKLVNSVCCFVSAAYISCFTNTSKVIQNLVHKEMETWWKPEILKKATSLCVWCPYLLVTHLISFAVL